MRVAAAGRLHLGFMDPSGRQARHFGSLGISLDRPETIVSLRRSPALEVAGPERERATRYVVQMAERLGVPPTFTLTVDQAITPHAGLGSGTQLALAVGHALAAVAGTPLSSAEIARVFGRGARSGIGIGAFDQGGVLVDGGHGPGSTVPPIVSRVPFPDEWRIVLIFDDAAVGVHGGEEREAFATLPDFPEQETAELCCRLLLHALPALVEANFLDFCREVGHLQRRMGAYYAPAQGGRFASPAIGEILTGLENEGLTGLGQSSWGPTGFVLARSEAEGRVLLHRLEARAAGGELRFDLARGRNRGARVETR